MEPTIRATLDELLAAVDMAEPVDLVAALTFPLPATVIFSFMGVPPEDYAQLKVSGGHRASLAWGLYLTVMCTVALITATVGLLSAGAAAAFA